MLMNDLYLGWGVITTSETGKGGILILNPFSWPQGVPCLPYFVGIWTKTPRISVFFSGFQQDTGDSDEKAGAFELRLTTDI